MDDNLHGYQNREMKEGQIWISRVAKLHLSLKNAHCNRDGVIIERNVEVALMDNLTTKMNTFKKM